MRYFCFQPLNWLQVEYQLSVTWQRVTLSHQMCLALVMAGAFIGFRSQQHGVWTRVGFGAIGAFAGVLLAVGLMKFAKFTLDCASRTSCLLRPAPSRAVMMEPDEFLRRRSDWDSMAGEYTLVKVGLVFLWFVVLIFSKIPDRMAFAVIGASMLALVLGIFAVGRVRKAAIGEFGLLCATCRCSLVDRILMIDDDRDFACTSCGQKVCDASDWEAA